MSSGEELLTVREVADVLRTNPDTVRDLMARGHIKYMKLGYYKIRRAELDRFIRDAEGMDFSDLRNPRPLVG